LLLPLLLQSSATSWSSVALETFTGTLTSPKVIAAFQIDPATASVRQCALRTNRHVNTLVPALSPAEQWGDGEARI